MNTISAIPAFTDNYIWAIAQNGEALVVDPGDAVPVLAWLAGQGLKLRSILLTHHHPDHIGGVAELVRQTGAETIGNGRDARRLPALSKTVSDGDQLELPVHGLSFSVIDTPGHTRGHICYFGMIDGAASLFCGDTLFSGGCGRMFEGEPIEYHASLMRLAALPDDTRLYCTHEYTLGNFAFAAQLTPEDEAIETALAETRRRRTQNQITLPSRLGWEKRHNPFLRCGQPALARAAGLPAGAPPAAVFGALRQAKNEFRGT